MTICLGWDQLEVLPTHGMRILPKISNYQVTLNALISHASSSMYSIFLWITLFERIFSDTHKFGMPAESFSAYRLSNVEVKGQYFTINVNSRNAETIANTLKKYTTIYSRTSMARTPLGP